VVYRPPFITSNNFSKRSRLESGKSTRKRNPQVIATDGYAGKQPRVLAEPDGRFRQSRRSAV